MKHTSKTVAWVGLAITVTACVARPLTVPVDAATIPVDATVLPPSDLAVSVNEIPIYGRWITGTGTLELCGGLTPIDEQQLVVQVDYVLNPGNRDVSFSIYYLDAGDDHLAGTRQDGNAASLNASQTFNAGYPPTTIQSANLYTADGVTATFALRGTSAGCAVAIDATLHRDGSP